MKVRNLFSLFLKTPKGEIVMKATDTIDNLEELEHIPEDKKDRYEEGLRVKRSVSCTVIEYFKAIKNKIIDPNPKCNRIDRDDLKKKQGILNVLFKDATLPDFSLIWKEILDGNHRSSLAVNDGGHRSRTIFEFIEGIITTGENCYYHPDGLSKEYIPNMTYAEIKEHHPAAAEIFEKFELILTIQWNLSAKQRKEDFDDRNESSKVEEQEKRNAHDDNVVAEWIRNTTKLVDGENNEKMIHKLFNKETIGYDNKKMIHDEILAKILLLTTKATVVTDHSHSNLDELYLGGSYAAGDNGIYYSHPKVFKKMTTEALRCCDFLYGVLSHWPTKSTASKSKLSTTYALIRWYFTYKHDMADKNATFLWNDEIKIDYKKFADEFHTLLHKLTTDTKLGIWVRSQKKERTFLDAFTGYLGEFKDTEKIAKSKEWIMKEFYKSAGKFGENFGITLFDSRETFDAKDIVNRWLDNDKKDDIRGDHDIPRSWGIKKGGVTEPSNMKILNETHNTKKSNKMTFNEYAETLKITKK